MKTIPQRLQAARNILLLRRKGKRRKKKKSWRQKRRRREIKQPDSLEGKVSGMALILPSTYKSARRNRPG